MNVIGIDLKHRGRKKGGAQKRKRTRSVRSKRQQREAERKKGVTTENVRVHGERSCLNRALRIERRNNRSEKFKKSTDRKKREADSPGQKQTSKRKWTPPKRKGQEESLRGGTKGRSAGWIEKKTKKSSRAMTS